jgi:biopolymer transport protein ExbB
MDFSVYWQHSDLISKSLYFILLTMSIVSWTVLILRLRRTQQLKQHAIPLLEQALQPYRQIRLTTEQSKAVVEQVLLSQIAQIKSQADKGCSVLGSIASIAPFVGLFGTVWGIFHALVAVGNSGQAGLAQVATPVGESLIMTGLGLAVAIPAVLAYNLCTRANRALFQRLDCKAHQLMIDALIAPNYKKEAA